MRKIIHVDADSFFASVEVRDNPSLKGRPIAVGGDPGRRGVLCTASYEARKFGVRSAMASAHALRLCPELLIIKPDMARYKEASEGMRHVFERFTDQIEPLSLDEAYLDVTESPQLSGSATWMAQSIQAQIQKDLHLTVSAGVAPIKFLAKVASDWRKPAGFYAVEPKSVEPFVADLSIKVLPGVGAVTATKLHRHGLYTCKDVRQVGERAMLQHFGLFGQQLYQRAWGRDDSRVTVDRVRKSLSVERTYEHDIQAADLNKAAQALAVDLELRFQRIKPDYCATKQFVKLKFSDFTQTVLETSLPSSAQWPPTAYFERLLHLAWHRYKQPVRLVGLGVRLKPALTTESRERFYQLQLF